MADVVLEDDQLRTLIVAIEQGRTIYDDIRKAVHFILATNLTEIMYTFTCVAAGFGEPLSPLQLLWINLITDVFPELALAAQPAEADVLKRAPREPARPMFIRSDLRHIAAEGLVMTVGSLAGCWAQTSARPSGPRSSPLKLPNTFRS
jgi:P-type Ca2+ transporter type 2C